MQYIRKLLFTDLDKTSIERILRQLRKLPWSECEPYLLNCFMKVYKGKYSQVHLMASLTAGLSRYHDGFAVAVVDEVITSTSNFFGEESDVTFKSEALTIPSVWLVVQTKRNLQFYRSVLLICLYSRHDDDFVRVYEEISWHHGMLIDHSLCWTKWMWTFAGLHEGLLHVCFALTDS